MNHISSRPQWFGWSTCVCVCVSLSLSLPLCFHTWISTVPCLPACMPSQPKLLHTLRSLAQPQAISLGKQVPGDGADLPPWIPSKHSESIPPWGPTQPHPSLPKPPSIRLAVCGERRHRLGVLRGYLSARRRELLRHLGCTWTDGQVDLVGLVGLVGLVDLVGSVGGSGGSGGSGWSSGSGGSCGSGGSGGVNTVRQPR